MKLTTKDIEEVMDTIKLNPSQESLALTKELNEQLIQTKGYAELIHMTAIMIMGRSIGKPTEVQELLMEGCGVSIMSGALIGYLLGLREAGLEMGIPSTPSTTDTSKSK